MRPSQLFLAVALSPLACAPPRATPVAAAPVLTTPAPTAPPAAPAPAVTQAPAPPADAWARPSWVRQPLSWTQESGPAPHSPSRDWKAVASGTAARLEAVAVAGDDVWIVGGEGTVLWSRDRGKSFSRAAIDPGERLLSVAIAGSARPWILGERHVYRIEAGDSVATLSVPIEGADGGKVWAMSPDDVWIAVNTLVHTLDGGASWTHLQPCSLSTAPDASSLGGGGIREVWGSDTDVWTVCSFTVHRSVDGGRSWSAPHGFSPSTEDSLHITGDRAGDIWIWGNYGTFARSSDGGATFADEHAPPAGQAMGVLSYQLWAAGGGWAWIAGTEGVWVRRGVRRWARESLPESAVVAIGGTSRRDVWAVGDNGLVLHRR